MYLKPSTRRVLNKCLASILEPVYFKQIPMREIIGMLDENGYVLVQEDNTPWAGILIGCEGRARFNIVIKDGMVPIGNTTLLIHWYKMPSKNTEVTGYFT